MDMDTNGLGIDPTGRGVELRPPIEGSTKEEGA
jgi:hypothetical protein